MKILMVLCMLGLLAAGFGFAQSKAGQPDEAEKLIASIRGPDLYTAYCAVCHGTDGKGGGPMAASLKTAPPDLTRMAARRGGMFPREEVRQIISGERQSPSGHGTREMPVWGPIFSQVAWDMDLGRVRIDNLARYLEQIQAR